MFAFLDVVFVKMQSKRSNIIVTHLNNNDVRSSAVNIESCKQQLLLVNWYVVCLCNTMTLWNVFVSASEKLFTILSVMCAFINIPDRWSASILWRRINYYGVGLTPFVVFFVAICLNLHRSVYLYRYLCRYLCHYLCPYLYGTATIRIAWLCYLYIVCLFFHLLWRRSVQLITFQRHCIDNNYSNTDVVW